MLYLILYRLNATYWVLKKNVLWVNECVCVCVAVFNLKHWLRKPQIHCELKICFWGFTENYFILIMMIITIILKSITTSDCGCCGRGWWVKWQVMPFNFGNDGYFHHSTTQILFNDLLIIFLECTVSTFCWINSVYTDEEELLNQRTEIGCFPFSFNLLYTLYSIL